MVKSKIVHLNLRVSDEIRKELVEAAETSLRSLNAEITFRLVESLRSDESARLQRVGHSAGRKGRSKGRLTSGKR
jgi:hypothetical protein